MSSRSSQARLLVFAVPALAAIAVAGCTALETRQPKDLGRYCQVRECICQEREASFLKTPETVPLQWTPEGNAYCPDGFFLRAILDKKKKKK